MIEFSEGDSIKLKFLDSSDDSDEYYGEVLIKLNKLVDEKGKWIIDRIEQIRKDLEVKGNVYIQAMFTTKKWDTKTPNINNNILRRLS